MRQNFFRNFACLLFLNSAAVGIPIDNGVEGDPEIECGSSAVMINFNVKNSFEGHVYVKGRYNETGCRSDDGGRKVANLAVPFASCGTERVRSLNPRGVFVRQTVVITFHPLFLTKVDRAYSVQCFYMEADKTVSQQLVDVSDMTSEFRSQSVLMPTCRYDILDATPTGQPVKFATIGQQVYHKWTCDTETTDIFCALVHNCQVDDGTGNRVNLLNEQGCALDKYLLQNLDYTNDLMAGKEAHVYKYADKAGLFFQCQIALTIKEFGQQCPRPQCPEPGGAGGGATSDCSQQPHCPSGPAAASPSSSAASAGKPPLDNKSIGKQLPAAEKYVQTVGKQLPPASKRPSAPPGAAYPPAATGGGPIAPPSPSPALKKQAAEKIAAAPASRPNRTRMLKDSPFFKHYRQRRHVPSDADSLVGIIDVIAPGIMAFDIDTDSSEVGEFQNSPKSSDGSTPPADQICISRGATLFLYLVVLFSVTISFIVSFAYCFKRKFSPSKKLLA